MEKSEVPNAEDVILKGNEAFGEAPVERRKSFCIT
jgi:hypothetical protein